MAKKPAGKSTGKRSGKNSAKNTKNAKGKKALTQKQALAKTEASSTSTSSDSLKTEPRFALTAQSELVRDVFGEAFRESLVSSALADDLQAVKKALYAREFSAAFGSEDRLFAYAARWSPTRALAYTDLLLRFEEQLEGLLVGDDVGKQLNVVSIGGCAAELASLAAYMKIRNGRRGLDGQVGEESPESDTEDDDASGESTVDEIAEEDKDNGIATEVNGVEGSTDANETNEVNNTDENNVDNSGSKDDAADAKESNGTSANRIAIEDCTRKADCVRVHLVDAGPWSPVLSRLYETMTRKTELSPHATAKAREKFVATSYVEPTDIAYTFQQANVLESDHWKEGMLKDGLWRPQTETGTGTSIQSQVQTETESRSEDQIQKDKQSTRPSDSHYQSLSGPSLQEQTEPSIPIRPRPSQPLLVTLFFTLNELYTEGGRGPTTTFLLSLTDLVPRGSLLLVVDSPSNYSETSVGSQTGPSVAPPVQTRSKAESDMAQTPTEPLVQTVQSLLTLETTQTQTPAQVSTKSLEESQTNSQTPSPKAKRVSFAEPVDQLATPVAKRYPMVWLLEHTLFHATSPWEDPDPELLPSQSETLPTTRARASSNTRSKTKSKAKKQAGWRPVVSESSTWFRVAEEVGSEYAIPLENMRYQVHLYERL